MQNADQVVAAHKAQLAAVHVMTGKALETIEKIAQLNMDSSKSSVEVHGEHVQSLLSVKDVKELARLNQGALHAMAEKTASYHEHLVKIALGMGNEFSELIEAQMANAQKEFIAAVEASMKNLPEAAEPMKHSVKNTLSAATDAMISVQEMVKEAAQKNHATLATVAENTVKATKAAKAAK
jgi:phasin family protein